ncbi:MAG: hypothetical protein ACKO22_06635 [Cyanobium sp.]
MPTRSMALAWAAAASLACQVAPVQAFTVYTNRAAWEAALSGATITTDTFSNTISSAQSITLDSGIVSTNSVPAILPNSFDNNSVNIVNPGVYDNATQAGTGNSASNTISKVFPTSVIGFGADFINTNTDRLTLNGDFDGTGIETILVNNTIGGSDGFLGVVGMADFSSIFFSNNTTVVDAFSIDNASFASRSIPAVPGPLPLLGAAAAFGWGRRLRKRLTVHERRGCPSGTNT